MLAIGVLKMGLLTLLGIGAAAATVAVVASSSNQPKETSSEKAERLAEEKKSREEWETEKIRAMHGGRAMWQNSD